MRYDVEWPSSVSSSGMGNPQWKRSPVSPWRLGRLESSLSEGTTGCEVFGTVVCDVVGLGAGIVDRLREMGYRVRAFNGGSFTSQQAKFLNLRASSYWNLRCLLEEGKIALPRDPGLFEELLAIRWFPTSEGKVQLERKVDMKRRLGKSPDKADAVSMAFGARGASMVVGEVIYAG